MILTQVICDGCGFVGAAGAVLISDARRSLRGQGWVEARSQHKRLDYCPACVASQKHIQPVLKKGPAPKARGAGLAGLADRMSRSHHRKPKENHPWRHGFVGNW